MKEAWTQLSGPNNIRVLLILFKSKAAFRIKEPLKITAQFRVKALYKTKTLLNRIQITLLSLVMLLSQPNQPADLNNLPELQKQKLLL